MSKKDRRPEKLTLRLPNLKKWQRLWPKKLLKMKIKALPKMEVMADGLMLGKGQVKIKCRRRALWVITPDARTAPPTLEEGAIQEVLLPLSPAGTTALS